jgi:hypothetical protein
MVTVYAAGTKRAYVESDIAELLIAPIFIFQQ